MQYNQNCIHPLSLRLVFLNFFQYPAILLLSKFKMAVFFNFLLCYSHFHNPISSFLEKISHLLLLLYYNFFYLTSEYHLYYLCQNHSQCVTVFYSMVYSTKFYNLDSSFSTVQPKLVFQSVTINPASWSLLSIYYSPQILPFSIS